MNHRPVNNLTFKIAVFLAGIPFLRSRRRLLHGLYYVWTIFWSLNAVDLSVLLISDLIAGKHGDLVNHFSFFISYSLAIFGVMLFTLHYKEWQELLQQLAAHHQLGVPPRFYKMQPLADFMGKAGVVYLNIVSIIYMVVMLRDEESCIKQYKGEKLCGMLNPTWWPPQIAITPFRKRVFLAYQYLSYQYMGCVLYLCFLVYQSVLQIGNRAEHLSKLYVQFCHVSYPVGMFKLWVEYHEETLRICRQLNWLFKRTLGHVSLIVAVTIASNVYQVVREHNAQALLYVGAFLMVIWILCSTGQKLEDTMMNIGDSVYDSDWYDCDRTVKYITLVVLERTQKRMGLDALPIGNVNHLLLVSVLKATYSFLTLLQQTME